MKEPIKRLLQRTSACSRVLARCSMRGRRALSPLAGRRAPGQAGGELRHGFRSPVAAHAILVDDAHFTGAGHCPSVGAWAEFLRRRRPGASIEQRDDMIRTLPATGARETDRAA